MATVFDVAFYILDKLGDMSTMKLQKLCYYARELYEFHRGEFLINSDKIKERKTDYNFSSAEKETLDIVISDYGSKEAFWLSELTHKERPWVETRGSLGLGERSDAIITKELMQEYYSGLVSNG